MAISSTTATSKLLPYDEYDDLTASAFADRTVLSHWKKLSSVVSDVTLDRMVLLNPVPTDSMPYCHELVNNMRGNKTRGASDLCSRREEDR